MNPIYLDYNATTPLDPRVAEAIWPYLSGGLAGRFGNPSSGHQYGKEAAAALGAARAKMAALLDCQPGEIVFTGCGSEADNLALVGVMEALRERGNHLITSQIEHPAILNTARYLERRGFRVTYLPVDATGRVNPDDVERAMTSETVLVSIMHANNEAGALQPVAEISARARSRGVLVHTDAAQSVGKVPTRVDELGVDLLTVAGHKLYAPKGIGALYVRTGAVLEPLIHGAGHEGGRRAGTENVPYAVGLGEAADLARQVLPEEQPRLRALRDRLHQRLAQAIPGLLLNGPEEERLPNTLNLSFPGVDAEELLVATPEVAASTGSACHSGRTEPSAVLLAMGLPCDRALGAVRLTVGRFTSEADVDLAAEALSRSWRELRGLP